MFTKIKGKTFLYFIFLSALFFTSCVNENLDKAFDIEDSNKGMFELPLEISLPYQDTIKTKSAATATELTIKDAYVLFFNSSNKYVSGTALTIASHITGNGTTTPKIKFPFKGSLSGVTKAVVLFNTGYTSATIPLTTSNTINDICTKFPSTNWGINTTTKGLPMSGTATVSNGTIGACTVTRAIAKVNVSTAGISYITSGSISNQPYSIKFNSFQWKLCNYTESGRIYVSVSGTDNTTYSFTNWGYGALTSSRYLGAYSNSTKAKTTTVTNTVFNKERTCVILKANVTENGTTKDCYYRLDFFNAGKYIDINRNTNYTFSIKSIKSRGYSSEEEALANPGGNVDYTLAEGSGSLCVHFSNGQYIVLADKHIVYVDYSYTSKVKNLMSVLFLSSGSSNPNFNKNITTRTVEIVGSDKKTRISTDLIQLYNSAGKAATGNILTLGEDDGVSAAYMLKVKTNETTLSNINNGTIYYIKISYGNIVGYIPIGVVFFDVKINLNPLPASGGSKTITITSRKFCPASIYEAVNIPERWNLTDSSPYMAGKINLYTSKILTGVETSGTGNKSFNVTLPENKYSPLKLTLSGTLSAGTKALRAKAAVSNIDLSYQNAKEISNQNTTIKSGKRSTANCYLVNAPGTYKFPMVYGNAIKNDVNNDISWKRTSGSYILARMVNYKGDGINSPWITGASRAELLWTDWPNLIKDVRIENGYVCFTVPKEEICEGNAVICIKDAKGTIIWSWHIWVTNYELGDGVSLLKGYHDVIDYIMPYELGFVDKTVYTEGEIGRGTDLTFTQTSTSTPRSVSVKQMHDNLTRDRYALFYRWGRKDPICGESVDIPSPVSFDVKHQNLWDNGADKYWYYKITPDEVPHSNVKKTVYDPSPVGFTVANRYAFSGLVTKKKFKDNQDFSSGKPGCAWGTSYNVTSKSDALTKGINVVTDFTKDNFRDIKDFVMKDYYHEKEITFHLDLSYNYKIWTAGFAEGYWESAHTFDASYYYYPEFNIDGVYIAPAGIFYLAGKLVGGKDGCWVSSGKNLVRPGFELN